ncbi:MAG: hypothetical protein GY769_17575 [bacterium]|nr:hypothetical protein [bacterium]
MTTTKESEKGGRQMENMSDMKIAKALAERERIQIQIREHEKAIEALKKERKPHHAVVEGFLGDDAEVEFSKWIIKKVDRAGYEVKASSYVSVKVNKAKLVAKKSAA